MNGPRLLLFALFCAALPLAAEPAPLSLAEALRLSAEAHETPRIAAARMERARASRKEALALLFPSLELVGTYKRAPGVTVETGGSERIIQRENALNGQAIFQATLVDLEGFSAYGRTKLLSEAARLDAAELSRSFAFEVAGSFFAVLAAEEVEKAARVRVEIATRAVLDAEARLSSGLGDKSSLTRAQMEEAAAELSAASALGALDTARASLSALVGRPVAALQPPAELAPAPATAEALEARPDLQSARLVEESARRARREPWLSLVPTLGLRAVASATNESGFVGNTNWNVAATLNWALYDGGLRYARAAARSAELEEAAASTSLVRRNAALEVQLAETRLTAATRSASAAETQSIVAARHAEETALRFRTGFATALEQTDASSSAFLAESELARQRFALRTAQLALLEALGRWPLADSEGSP